jgi:hypothetical protein
MTLTYTYVVGSAFTAVLKRYEVSTGKYRHFEVTQCCHVQNQFVLEVCLLDQKD